MFKELVNVNITVDGKVFDLVQLLKEKLYWFDHFALSDIELLALSKIMPEDVKPDGLTQVKSASETFDILIEKIYSEAIYKFLS